MPVCLRRGRARGGGAIARPHVGGSAAFARGIPSINRWLLDKLVTGRAVENWTRVQVAAGLSTVALARMQSHTLDPDSAQALHDAAAELQEAWAALIHPDAYYIHIPQHLKQRWLELDLLVQPELARFNLAITEYNQAIVQYPAALLAKLFQFQAATPL